MKNILIEAGKVMAHKIKDLRYIQIWLILNHIIAVGEKSININEYIHTVSIKCIHPDTLCTFLFKLNLIDAAHSLLYFLSQSLPLLLIAA